MNEADIRPNYSLRDIIELHKKEIGNKKPKEDEKNQIEQTNERKGDGAGKSKWVERNVIIYSLI